MIASLRGILLEKQPTRAVVEVGGVGYEVAISVGSYDRLPDENAECRLFTHHHVREDVQDLYGFVTEEERSLFRLLLGVSGIGPKTAMSALSGMSVRELKASVAGGDVKRLSSISGIGKKTAERIVLELRDKLTAGESMEALSGAAPAAPGDLRLRDAILALVSLGYKQAEAQQRVQDASARAGRDAPVEALIRLALGR